MEIEKIAQTITHLRKKAGYTQKELADRIGISDKAVSKWERAQGLPDIAYLRKLSVLLDTDVDSLLVGDISFHANDFCGLIYTRENNNVVKMDSLIADKPLCDYLIGYFVLVGIKKIFICCNENDNAYINQRYSGGEEYNISLEYPKELTKNCFDRYSNVMCIFDKDIIYGVDLTRFLQKAMVNKEKTIILSLPKKPKDNLSKLTFDSQKRITFFDEDDRIISQYNYYYIPILFVPIDKFLQIYRQDEKKSFIDMLMQSDTVVHTEQLDRGFIEMLIENDSDIKDGDTMIKLIEKYCGMYVQSIEEICWRRGLISKQQFIKLANKHEGSYRDYLLGLVE